jgi:hypothetical protein
MVNRSRFVVNGTGFSGNGDEITANAADSWTNEGRFAGNGLAVTANRAGITTNCGQVTMTRLSVMESGGRFTVTRPSVMESGGRFTVTGISVMESGGRFAVRPRAPVGLYANLPTTPPSVRATSSTVVSWRVNPAAASLNTRR